MPARTVRQDVRRSSKEALTYRINWFERFREGWFTRLNGWIGYGRALIWPVDLVSAEPVHSCGVAAGGNPHGAIAASEDTLDIKSKQDSLNSAPSDCRKDASAGHESQRFTRPTWKEAVHMNADSKQKLRVHIRWMIRRDMSEVLDIEQASFEFPWLEEDFILCLRQRNCIGMIAEHGDKVVGFMIYELHKSRLHILNFSVSDQVRHQSVGQQMIDKLVSKLSGQRRTRITLEVRETNLAAQLFFKANGFRAISVLRSYYEDSPEDAYVMQYRYEPKAVAVPTPQRINRLAG
jgi:ribosomal-protein-alanine N-acetyltransferase